MKLRFAKVIAAILVLALLAGCGGASKQPSQSGGSPSPAPQAQAVRGVTKDTIKLGVIDVQTGANAANGNIRNTIFAYFKAINDAGGIHGRKIEIIAEDSGYDAQKAQAAARKLLERDQVFGIVHSWGTPMTLAIAPLIEQFKAPTIPMGMSRPLFEPVKPYIFGIGVPYGLLGARTVDYIVNEIKRPNAKLHLITYEGAVGDDFSGGIKKSQEVYPDLKVTIDFFKAASKTDFSGEVLNAIKNNADFIVLGTAWPEASAVVKEADKQGFKGKVISGVGQAFSPQMIKLLGPLAEGYISSTDFAYWHETNIPGVKTMVDAHQKYSYSSEIERANPNGVIAWAAAEVYTEGLRRAGPDLTPEKFIAAMESLKNFDIKGLGGTVTYGPDRRISASQGRMIQVKNGQIVEISGWAEPAYLKKK